MAAKTFFVVGARVLVDGRDEALVRGAFPKGSSSYLFPHYKIDFVGGARNVAVPMARVGVQRDMVPAPREGLQMDLVPEGT